MHYLLLRSLRSKYLLALCVLLAGVGRSYAQGPAVFEAASNMNEVQAGYRFEVSFTLRNAEAKSFRPPDFQGFKPIGPSENQHGVTMINGKSFVHQTWSFEVEALKEGVYTIGAATVTTADGQTLRTKPFNIKVVAPQSSNLPRGSEDIFVAGEFSSSTVYVGQQVKYRIKVYTRLMVEGADILELPRFDGFYAREMKRFDTRVQYQTIKGKKYAVRVLHEVALFPQAPGEISVGITRLRFDVQKEGAPSTIFGPAITPMLLQTTPGKLKVKDLPLPEPSNFAGIVGQYQAKFTLDRDTLSTDDALTLVVEIEGTGDARRLQPIQIALPDGLETFDPKVREEEEYESVDRAMHRKVFEYIVMPKKPGSYSLSPELVFFDPDSNRYVVQRPDQPLAFYVSQGKNLAPLPPVDTSGQAQSDGNQPGGFVYKLKSWGKSPWVWAAVALPLLLLIGLLRRKKRPVQPPAPPPAPAPSRPAPAPAAAPRDAQEIFANARRLLSNDSPRLFFDALYKALRTWASALLAVPAPELTPDLLRERLSARRVPEARIEALIQAWQTCEQAVFAGQHAYLDMDRTWRTAEDTIREIERDWKRGA